MSESPALILLLALLALIVFAAGWLVGRRRTHALEIELAQARAELDSGERLRVGFDAVAGAALRSNSEVFLQLARQTLGQQQQVAARDLADREQSVASLLAPVREALARTHEQIARIEKERAEAFGSLRASLEGVALGQQALQRETRTSSPRCAGPRCAASGAR